MSVTYVYYIISIPVAGLIQGRGTLQGTLLPFLYRKGTLEDTHVFSPLSYALYSWLLSRGNAYLVINVCIFPFSFHPAEGLVMNTGGEPLEQWAEQLVDLAPGP